MRLIWARIISRIFDPLLEIPAAILLAVYVAVSEGIRWRFLGVLLFFDLLLPFVFFLTLLYHKQVTSFDIRERHERLPVYVFGLLCHLAGVGLAYSLGKGELAATLGRFLLVGVVFVVITTKWKISLHGAVNAFLPTLVVGVFGWEYTWLYLAVPLVGWARVVDKHHTWQQYAAGAGLGAIGAALALV